MQKGADFAKYSAGRIEAIISEPAKLIILAYSKNFKKIFAQ